MRIILHYNRRKLSGRAPVEFEIPFTRTDRVFISTKILIDAKEWDAAAGQVTGRHKDSMEYNMRIKALRDRLNEIDTMYRAKDETLTGELLKIELANKPPSTTFNDYFARQLEIDRPGLKESTYRRLRSVLKNLNEFRIITFMNCDTEFIRVFHNHLLKTMQQTTTPKNHKTISKYMKRAVNDGLLKMNPYQNFKIPAYSNRKVYLTKIELERIRTKQIDIERLAVVRDMFLWMCNTGMEYVDMMKLTQNNIAEIQGRLYIVKSRVKVEGEIQAIPLFPEAVEILNRYSTGTGLIFPPRSNQRLNGYLKELATICDVDKPLTTIVARHTFATQMLDRGMPIETVSHIMGHSNIKTTRGYAKLLVSKIELDLQRLDIKGI
jgi:site-specific recombinase XerD